MYLNIDNVVREISRHDTRLDRLEKRLNELESKLNELNLTSLENRITELENRVLETERSTDYTAEEAIKIQVMLKSLISMTMAGQNMRKTEEILRALKEAADKELKLIHENHNHILTLFKVEPEEGKQ